MSAVKNQFAALEDDTIEHLQNLLLSSGSSESTTGSSTRASKPPVEKPSARSYQPAESSGKSDGASEAAYKLKNPIVWMDLEMTGLDPEKDHIMEIAVLITDGDLTLPYLEGPDLILHLPDEILDDMNEWCQNTHGKSGLTQKCKNSSLSLTDAETQVLEFVQRHTQSMEVPGPAEYKAHLAGNSIYVDRAFLQRHMPRIHAHLHWRLIDVSTLLELSRRWFPQEFRHAPKKRMLHTAMADIRESLNELKFYRRHVFKQPGIQYKEYLALRPSETPQGSSSRPPVTKRRGRR